MLRIALLGEQTVVDDDGRPRSRSSRTLALIAFLVLHAGAPQPRQRIAGLFWPDSADAQALTNLRRELHHLRHALRGRRALVVTARPVLARQPGPAGRLRVFDLERRTAALAAAAAGRTERGPRARRTRARGSTAASSCPASTTTGCSRRGPRLERQCVELCDLLVPRPAPDRRPGRGARGRPAADPARPLEEVGYRTLMQLQVEPGDRAGARQHLPPLRGGARARARGRPRTAATRAAVDALIGPPGPPPRPGRAGRAAPDRPRARSSAGRGRVRCDLEARPPARAAPAWRWSAARAGVGKTRLVAEVARGPRGRGRGGRTPSASARPAGCVLAPVAEWLRTPELRARAGARTRLARRGEPARPAPAPGPVRRPSRRPVPGHGRRLAAAPLLRGPGPRVARASAGRCCWCSTTCSGATRRRWRSSAFCLRSPSLGAPAAAGRGHAARRRAARRPGARRLAGPDAGRRSLVDQSRSDPLGRGRRRRGSSAAVAGTPLSGDDAALVARGDAAASRCTSSRPPGAGRPEPAAARGPRRPCCAAGSSRLGAAARQVAGLAAAVGRDFTLDLLTEASDLDAEEVARAVDELWRLSDPPRAGRRLRLLPRPAPGRRLRAGQPGRSAGCCTGGSRRRWSCGTPTTWTRSPALLAEQYDRGGRPERALEYYLRAAEVAAARVRPGRGDPAAHARRWRSCGRGRRDGERDRRRAGRPGGMAAPLNARTGYSVPQLRRPCWSGPSRWPRPPAATDRWSTRWSGSGLAVRAGRPRGPRGGRRGRSPWPMPGTDETCGPGALRVRRVGHRVSAVRPRRSRTSTLATSASATRSRW